MSIFFSVQWDYCDLSKRQYRSVLLDYKEKSYCSYLLRYWVAPSSVLWVVQEFFEIKILEFWCKGSWKAHDKTPYKCFENKIAILAAQLQI